MPKLGMEPIRKEALVRATIAEIGANGSLDVTVAQIARRAGMSSGLAHHYFGGKEDMFLAAMRHTLSVYAAEVRGALTMASSPHERVEAIVRAGFSQSNFRKDVLAAWLNFYVLANTNEHAHRLLVIYQSRLRSNLRHALRSNFGPKATELANRLAALIDGVYLQVGLTQDSPDRDAAVHLVLHAIACEPVVGSDAS